MTERAGGPGAVAPGTAAGSVDETELCVVADDLLRLNSRLAMGQLFRPWLDAQWLTVSEVLHHHKSLKALLEQGALVEAALARVAGVQGRSPGQDPRRRRDFLQAAAAELLARAGRLERALEVSPRSVPPATDQGAVLLAAVCRDLVTTRSWSRKLALLLELARDDAGGHAVEQFDAVIADLLGQGAVVEDLVGPHRFRGAALRRVLELALQPLPMLNGAGGASPGTLVGLNQLLRNGRLPQARDALLEWVRSQLRAPLPLASGRREEEIRQFHDLLALLVQPEGVAGGAAMADALVHRYARRLDHGGATGVRLSMQGIVESLPNLLSRLQFLAALAGTDLGLRSTNDLVLLVESQANNDRLLEAAVFKPFEPAALSDGLARAATAFDHTGFPPEVKARLRERITGLVDGFVVRGSLLDLMDEAEPALGRRIAGLDQLVASGLVSEFGGKPLVHQHIAKLLARKTAERPPAPAPGPSRPSLARPEVGLTARFGRHRCPSCFEPKGGSGMCMVCGHDETEGLRPGVHLIAGTVLRDRYVVGRLIGQGGFGATYLGWDERVQAKVAIKEYFPVSLAGRAAGSASLMPYTEDHKTTFQSGITKFLEEASLLARLREVQEIVHVLDCFELNATAYMVMELLVGRTMQRHLLEEGGAIDYRRALGLILPIAKAVHDVHQLGLIHRDISPDNIFLLDDGRAKLLDFGAARHSIGEAIGERTVILKRGYAPPEQYTTSGAQGPWTDVYALCATFYCAITGRTPPEATARLGGDDPLVRPSVLGISLPAAVEDALFVGLALRWQDRPRDMKTLLQAFNRALM